MRHWMNHPPPKANQYPIATLIREIPFESGGEYCGIMHISVKLYCTPGSYDSLTVHSDKNNDTTGR